MLRVPNRRSPRLAMALVVILGSGCHAPIVPLPEAATSRASSVVAKLAKAPAIPSAVAWTDCNLEQVDGQAFSGEPIRVTQGADFKVAGFMFDRDRQSVPDVIRLRIEAGPGTAFEAPVAGRVRRPDIPAYFKLGPWAEETGVEQDVSSRGLSPGAYHLLLVGRIGDATAVCDNGRTIMLAGNVPSNTNPKETR